MSKGKTVTQSTTDPAQMAMYQDLYDKSKGIASQPFVPYTGAKVAGFNPDQLQGFDATRYMFNQSMGYDPRQKLNNLANQPTPSVTPYTGTATNLQPAAMQTGANIAPVDSYGGASIDRNDIRNVQPKSLLDTDLNAYQNPFQSQVIDNTLGDLNRARQMQLQSDQDAAIGRNAFGGSRSALLESETNRNFAEQAARTAGDLRSQGFDKATALAGQDIGRQFDADKYMSGIDSNVAMQNASFGQQAGLASQGLLGDMSINQAKLDAAKFGADQNALNQFGLQQGSYNNAMNMANMDAINKAKFMQPGLDMQNKQFQAGIFGNQLSDQYRNLGLLSGIGSQQQGLQQAGMDAGYNEFLRAINYGPQQLNLLSQGLSGMPVNSSQSEGYKPGTADYLQTALSIFGLSDKRLKENIKLVDKVKGHNVYTWDWNDTAKKLGVTSPTKGVIAQEILQSNPEAIALHESGYLMVNYGAL